MRKLLPLALFIMTTVASISGAETVNFPNLNQIIQFSSVTGELTELDTLPYPSSRNYLNNGELLYITPIRGGIIDEYDPETGNLRTIHRGSFARTFFFRGGFITESRQYTDGEGFRFNLYSLGRGEPVKISDFSLDLFISSFLMKEGTLYLAGGTRDNQELVCYAVDPSRGSTEIIFTTTKAKDFLRIFPTEAGIGLFSIPQKPTRPPERIWLQENSNSWTQMEVLPQYSDCTFIGRALYETETDLVLLPLADRKNRIALVSLDQLFSGYEEPPYSDVPPLKPVGRIGSYICFLGRNYLIKGSEKFVAWNIDNPEDSLTLKIPPSKVAPIDLKD